MTTTTALTGLPSCLAWVSFPDRHSKQLADNTARNAAHAKRSVGNVVASLSEIAGFLKSLSHLRQCRAIIARGNRYLQIKRSNGTIVDGLYQSCHFSLGSDGRVAQAKICVLNSATAYEYMAECDLADIKHITSSERK